MIPNMKYKDRLKIRLKQKKGKYVCMSIERNEEVHIFELHQQKCVAGRQDKKI